MTIGYLELTLNGVEVEFVVEYEYESDEPEMITECFIVQYESSSKNWNLVDIIDLLTDDNIVQLGQQAIEDLQGQAELRCAMAEDAADSRAQYARECQQEALRDGISQRGVKL